MKILNRNRVPDNYFGESRDFQLLCNLYDCLDMGVKFDIDSILNLTSTQFIHENALPHLQSKLGFFTNLNISGEKLRIILKGFPYLLKYKGSREGIIKCIHLFLNTINLERTSGVDVINSKVTQSPEGYSINNDVYIVNINLKTEILDGTLLDEMLKYIIPAGYGVNYIFYGDSKIVQNFGYKDCVTIYFVNSEQASQVTPKTNELYPSAKWSKIYKGDN